MQVEITIEGKEGLLAAFKTLESGISDLRQLGTWKAVASEFYKIEKEQFSTEGGAGASGKWAPLSTAYEVQKQKKYGSVSILQASGKMYRSLTSSGGPDSVYEESAQELVVGSSSPIPGYHQSGTRRMPQRKPVDVSDAQKQRLADVLTAKLKQLAANARLRDVRGF